MLWKGAMSTSAVKRRLVYRAQIGKQAWIGVLGEFLDKWLDIWEGMVCSAWWAGDVRRPT